MMVYTPKIKNRYLWTIDWSIFHLCQSISPKVAYGCQKISIGNLQKYDELFWPKSSLNESKEESGLYDVDLKSKEEILNQDFPNYVKSMCNKLTNVHDWLENLIQNNAMFLTTYKVKPQTRHTKYVLNFEIFKIFHYFVIIFVV